LQQTINYVSIEKKFFLDKNNIMENENIRYTEEIDIYLENIAKTYLDNNFIINSISIDFETNIIEILFQLNNRKYLFYLDSDGFLYDSNKKILGIEDKKVYSEIYDYIEIDRLY
jgi:hypothetical protein